MPRTRSHWRQVRRAAQAATAAREAEEILAGGDRPSAPPALSRAARRAIIRSRQPRVTFTALTRLQRESAGGELARRFG